MSILTSRTHSSHQRFRELYKLLGFELASGMQVVKLGVRLFLLETILLGNCTDSFGQLARTSQEVWPSADVFYRLNSRFRLYTTVAATKQDGSNYSEGALGIFGDYFVHKLLKSVQRGHADSLPGHLVWFRAGYQYSATPPSSEDPFRESMFVTEANSRFYLPYLVLLTVKNRFDWRVNNGDFKTRYRPRITIERDLRTHYLSFTASVFGEYFANFGSSSVNRFRVQAGLEIRVLRNVNYEVFWNHQFAHQPEVPELDAFGMTLKLYFTAKRKKKSS